jgi:hypothetical protein
MEDSNARRFASVLRSRPLRRQDLCKQRQWRDRQQHPDRCEHGDGSKLKKWGSETFLIVFVGRSRRTTACGRGSSGARGQSDTGR